MTDTFSQKERSRIMRAVKSKGNKSTEIKLIAMFKERRMTGWRRGYPLPGKPDFVFPKARAAVFADGCFWHGHNCRNTRPSANREYWEAKIARNRARDRKVRRKLRAMGWHVFGIWECKIKRSKLPMRLSELVKG